MEDKQLRPTAVLVPRAIWHAMESLNHDLVTFIVWEDEGTEPEGTVKNSFS